MDTIGFVLLPILAFVVASASAFDFCDIERTKCQSNPHIGCNASKTFEVNPKCFKVQILPMTNRMRNVILETHNKLRDELASGRVRSYPPANKMLRMTWDHELELTACKHVEFCRFEHDRCRATPNHLHPGQNIRRAEYVTYPQANYTTELIKGISDWFNEHKDVPSDIVEKYQLGRSNKTYGHFTVMSKDVNDRVGCCYITYEEENDGFFWYNHLFTCNYRQTNIISHPVYAKGEPASQCKDWGKGYQKSPKYPSLCENVSSNDTLQEEPLPEQPSFTTQSELYCHLAKLKCGRMRHVGCNFDPGLVNKACLDLTVIRLSEDLKTFVVDFHNNRRNEVASGARNLPIASKMLEMQWDSELEDVSCAHVSRCLYEPSECSSTISYDQPGENLYNMYFSAPNSSYRLILAEAMNMWFDTNQALSSPDIIDAFNIDGSGLYGQFTQMVMEGNNKMGCCYSTYRESTDEWHKHLITCTYKNANVISRPVYSKGEEAASQCYEWGSECHRSSHYPNLCSSGESEEPYTVEATTSYFEKESTDISETTTDHEKMPARDLTLFCKQHCSSILTITHDIDNINFVPANEVLRSRIVKTYNEEKSANDVEKDDFSSAQSNFTKTEWDDELAKDTCEYLSYCFYCWSGAGQPISTGHSRSTRSQTSHNANILSRTIDGWFAEYKQVSHKVIEGYRKRSWSGFQEEPSEHLNNKVGCCYVKYQIRRGNSVSRSLLNNLFVCNHREKDILYTDSYEIGESPLKRLVLT